MDNEAFAELVLRRQADTRPSFPQSFSDPDGDCIELVLSPEQYYAERVDNLVTVYYGRESGEIVGAILKGVSKFVRSVLAQAPGFAVEIQDGRVRLAYLFSARMWAQEDMQPDLVFLYQKLRDAANRLEADTVAVAQE